MTESPRTNLEAADHRLRISPEGADREILLAAVEGHRRSIEEGRGILKNEHKTSITQPSVRGRDFIVKHYRYMGPRFYLKSLVRAHPGRRSFRAGMEMEARGVPTPPLVGLLELQRFGLVVESWFVTEAIAGAKEMDRYIANTFPRRCDFHRRRRFVAAFADSLRRLFGSGIRHRDLKTCNVLVVEDGDDWQFAYIDLDDVKVKAATASITRADWVLALAHLNPSTPKDLPWTDRLRLLDRLPELAVFDRKALVTDIQRISRHRGRAYFTDEGVVEVEFVA